VPEDLNISPEFTIASGVTLANSDTTTPGRPAIAFDGTNYLAVSCREVTSPAGIFGVIVSGQGVVLETFHIANINPVFGCQGQRPSVAFDGTNYLVAFSGVTDTGSSAIVGVRVTPSGTVLDGPEGFTILSGVADAAAVAFDGTNYLVVSVKFNNDTLHDIVGATVNTAGQVLNEFPIFTAPGGQVLPSIAFDGVNYLVLWSDTRSGSPVGPDADIYGTRVTPGEVVLEPEGIPISTAPGIQEWPHVIFDGTNYFAVWEDTRNDPDVFPPRLDIFGTRITPAGTLLDGPSDTGGIAINTAAFPKQHPTVAFDGTYYFVTWEASFFYDPPVGIFAARVSTAGQLVDGAPDAEGIPISQPSCFTCRLVLPNVLFNGKNLLLAWVNNSELSGTAKDIAGVLISPAAPTIVPFSDLDTKLLLSKNTQGKGAFSAKGSFVLGATSDGVDPVAQPVVFSLADTNGSFFDQTLPASSFKPFQKKGFIFRAPKRSKGIHLMIIRPAKTSGQFTFEVIGKALDLDSADSPPVTISLQVGDDKGAETIPCHALSNLLICR